MSGKIDLKQIGDRQIAMLSQSIDHALEEEKKEIADYLYENFSIEIDADRLENTERFTAGIQNIENYLPTERKNSFSRLMEMKNKLDKEISERQQKMLQEIGILSPSIRVCEIMKQMKGGNFGEFSEMIKYLKTSKEKRAERKQRIEVPKKLLELATKLNTTLLTILEKNMGPAAQ